MKKINLGLKFRAEGILQSVLTVLLSLKNDDDGSVICRLSRRTTSLSNFDGHSSTYNECISEESP